MGSAQGNETGSHHKALWIVAITIGAVVPGEVVTAMKISLSVNAHMVSSPAPVWLGWLETVLGSSLLAGAMVIPWFEGLRPRRRTVRRSVTVTGLVCLAAGAATALMPEFGEWSPAHEGILAVIAFVLVVMTGVAHFVSIGAYVGCLHQTDRVRWLLLYGITTAVGIGVATPLVVATDLLHRGMGYCFAGLLVVTAGLAAGRWLPEFGRREAPADSRQWRVIIRSILYELKATPGAWTCLAALIVVPLPAAMGCTLGLALWKPSEGIGISKIVGLGLGALVGWLVVRRASPVRALWLVAPGAIVSAGAWALAGPLQSLAIAACTIAFVTEFVRSFFTVLLLVLTFRIFGDSRYYLSLYALAVAVPALVGRLVLAGVAQLQTAAGVLAVVAATILIAVVAAVWAVIARQRLMAVLIDQEWIE